MSPSDPPHDLLSSLADRWAKAQDTDRDAQALVRLTILEARRNLAVLDVAVGQAKALPPAVLWEIPAILQTHALGAVLGQGALTTPSFAALRRLRPTDGEAGPEAADILTQLYVRIAALKALAPLRKRGDLRGMRLKNWLTSLRTDFIRVVVVLGREVKK